MGVIGLYHNSDTAEIEPDAEAASLNGFITKSKFIFVIVFAGIVLLDGLKPYKIIDGPHVLLYKTDVNVRFVSFRV